VFLGKGTVSSAILALSRQEANGNDSSRSLRSSSYGTIEEDIPSQQTPIIWAYEKGKSQFILTSFKNYRFKDTIKSLFCSNITQINEPIRMFVPSTGTTQFLRNSFKQ
jgi:hypothetical protein